MRLEHRRDRASSPSCVARGRARRRQRHARHPGAPPRHEGGHAAARSRSSSCAGTGRRIDAHGETREAQSWRALGTASKALRVGVDIEGHRRRTASRTDALVVRARRPRRRRAARGRRSTRTDGSRSTTRSRACGHVPLPPYIKRDVRRRGRASATRPSSRAPRAPSPRRPRASTSRAALLERLAVARLRGRDVHAARRARARSSRSPSTISTITRCTPSASRSRATLAAADRARARARRAGRSPSARPSCARSSSAADPERARPRARRAPSETRLLIQPGLRVPRRRSAPHELPPAQVDAARARLRVRGHRARARRVRDGRDASATASSPTATRCCSIARARPRMTAPRTPGFAFRVVAHRRARARRACSRRRTATSRRRRSCPSARRAA